MSSFGVGSDIEKREQEVLQFVAQAHVDSFKEYERLHNKVALWRGREFSQIVIMRASQYLRVQSQKFYTVKDVNLVLKEHWLFKNCFYSYFVVL